MRFFALFTIVLALLASRPADALTISSSMDVGAVPANGGTGLATKYYQFSSEPTSLSQAATMIASSSGPIATFITSAICYPDCAGNTVNDSPETMTQYVGSNVSNFTYTVPQSQIPTNIANTAMVITGYIAITQAGTYTFNLGSDDGSSLTIGGQQIIDNDSQHSFQVDTATATFTQAGLYAISINDFEASGSAGLDFYVSNPSGTCIIGRAANCAAGTASTGLLYSTLPAGSVPEPASLWVMGSGLAGLFFVLRRRRLA